jgi:LEA14-like dessication related protein
LLLAACSKPQSPTVTPRSIQVTSVSPAGITLGVALDVYNPNGFPLLARAVDGTLDLGAGAAASHAHAELSSPVPAKGSSVVSSSIDVSSANLVNLLPFALAGRPVHYTFRGTAEFGGESLNVRLPFQLQGDLSQAQLLQAGLRGAQP